MCIAIVKPLDKTISEDRLRTCYNNNKDGCGFAYIKDNAIFVKKFMEFEAFYKEYKLVETTSPMLIHFRIATHGKVELDNCHPFKLNNRMVLIHNGIISGYGDKEKKSDTRDYIDKVLSKISWKMWKNPAFREMVGQAIGYSKLGIMDVSGEMYIINYNKGVVEDGVWYSNSSFKEYEPKTTTSRTNYKYDYNKYYAYDNDDKYQLIYKCKACGKEYVKNENEDAVCDVCKSIRSEEIGFIYDGVRYYYKDEGYENQMKFAF